MTQVEIAIPWNGGKHEDLKEKDTTPHCLCHGYDELMFKMEEEKP